MTNEKMAKPNNNYSTFFSDPDICNLYVRLLWKIRDCFSGGEFSINVLCFFIVLIAIRNIHCQTFNLPRDHFSPYMVAMGFPLLFNIRMKILKYPAIIIGAIACIFQQQWIPYFCIGIGSFILLSKNRKLTAVIFLCLAILFTAFIFQKEQKGNKSLSIMASIQNRIVFYNYTLENWHNFWRGEGFDKFKMLPHNQPDNNDYRAWIRSAHSDLLQGFFELGAIRMWGILTVIFLPLAFLRLQGMADYSIFASYLCLIFQGLIDFPFHRWTTGLLGLTIILMMYKQFVFKEA